MIKRLQPDKMIHQFSQSCELFFKLCEKSTYQKENKLSSLAHVLAELNYFCLKLIEEKSEYENEQEEQHIKKAERITSDQVRPFISKSFPDLGFYWCILNPNEMTEYPQFGTGDAKDDILDIYKDLKEGDEHYKNGNLGEAFNVWKQSYEIHWGEHLVDLQALIHSLIH